MAYPEPPTPSTEDLATIVLWYDQLISFYPEFADAPTAVAYNAIGQALARTPLDVWGDLHSLGVFALAGHLLALSPGGERMRIDALDTLYYRERRRLTRIVASGFRVAGLPDGY